MTEWLMFVCLCVCARVYVSVRVFQKHNRYWQRSDILAKWNFSHSKVCVANSLWLLCGSGTLISSPDDFSDQSPLLRMNCLSATLLQIPQTATKGQLSAQFIQFNRCILLFCVRKHKSIAYYQRRKKLCQSKKLRPSSQDMESVKSCCIGQSTACYKSSALCIICANVSHKFVLKSYSRCWLSSEAEL